MQLQIDPLVGQPFGALVTGWEPAEIIDGAAYAQLAKAIEDHLLLVFRGQAQPTDDELVRFAAAFGPLIKGSEWFRDAGDRPEILPVTNAVGDDGVPLGTGGAGRLEWHADYSYVTAPAKESFLNAIELPPSGPRTHFCNQYEALRTLPDDLVEELRTMRAHHSVAEYVERGVAAGEHQLDDGFEAKRRRDEALGIERPAIPEAEHPVVFRHPETDRELLYVSKGLTRQILGLPKPESSALLKRLHEHSTRPEMVYTHEWQVGDMVVFDALGSLHRRDSWNRAERRVMRQLSTSC